jgi:thioredoxin reductase (NADPH)
MPDDTTPENGASPAAALDCLIIGAGPAGLTAALYLARFGRRFAIIDDARSRAARIPLSHNIPFFEQGIAGTALLQRQISHVGRYGVAILPGRITSLRRHDSGFTAERAEPGAAALTARHILLATGAIDIEPELPDLPHAVQSGLVRYCPICDGFEARGKRIAVLGHAAHALAEAVFIARTYSHDVTLLTLGGTLDPAQRELARAHHLKLLEHPIRSLRILDGKIDSLHVDGQDFRFDVLYSALGLQYRTGLGESLGAALDEAGGLCVDRHNQTTVPGLYAAGDVARGLDQIAVAMGDAAIAATHIHNKCELPTEAET